MLVVRSGLVCAALLVPMQAWGQSDATRAAARDLGAEGVEDFQAGNYGPASEKLDRAFDILRAPSLGLWSARALVKNGKLVEASERYLVVSRLDASKGDVAVQKQAQADAATEREALQARIPALTLSVKGATGDIAVTLDGAPVPSALVGVKQPANPGKHQAEARQGGFLVRAEITLTEGKRAILTLDFARAVPAPAGAAPAATANAEPASESASDEPVAADTGSSRVPVGVWIGLGVAGAGLVTGGVTAGLAASKKSELDCPDGHCQPSQGADVDAHNRLLTISTIGFIAAGVGAATAGVFWFTRPKTQTAFITPFVGVGSAGVLGAF